MKLSELLIQLMETAASLNPDHDDILGSELDVDPEIRIAMQPRWPMEHHISHIKLFHTNAEDIAELEDILSKYTRTDHVKLINCGGDDLIASAREQWNDGSNTLCIAPGKIVVYERNDVTNAILRDEGIQVLEMPSAELSRGRGGPRCMSMPIIRAE